MRQSAFHFSLLRLRVLTFKKDIIKVRGLLKELRNDEKRLQTKQVLIIGYRLNKLSYRCTMTYYTGKKIIEVLHELIWKDFRDILFGGEKQGSKIVCATFCGLGRVWQYKFAFACISIEKHWRDTQDATFRGTWSGNSVNRDKGGNKNYQLYVIIYYFHLFWNQWSFLHNFNKFPTH